MGTITLTLPVAGNQITAGLHAANYAAIQAAINGDIDSANIEDGSVGRTELATITRKCAMVYQGGTSAGLTTLGWPDGSTESRQYFCIVPDDYVSGDISIKFNRRGAAAGTAVMNYSVNRFRDTAAVSVIHSAVAANFTPGATTTALTGITVAAANFQAGDVLRFTLERVGADAGDTMAAAVVDDGVWIEYSGKA